jgi:putative hydrolase of the HAD superfamily
MRYEAVIFDLFGTLVPNVPQWQYERSVEEMADKVGVAPREFVRLWLQTSEYRATGRFPSIDANIEYILGVTRVVADDDGITAAVELRRAFTRGMLEPRSGAIETLTRLRRLGCKIGLISDCSPEVPLLWRETFLEPLVDMTIFSCEMKIRKPDPRIYQAACDGLALGPRDCLYVGDGGSHELSGAARAGMHPLLIRVPTDGEDLYRTGVEEWSGAEISSLQAVLSLLE